jgi:hypothetical protein
MNKNFTVTIINNSRSMENIEFIDKDLGIIVIEYLDKLHNKEIAGLCVLINK